MEREGGTTSPRKARKPPLRGVVRFERVKKERWRPPSWIRRVFGRPWPGLRTTIAITVLTEEAE